MTTAIIGIRNIGGTVARQLASGGDQVVLSAVNAQDVAKLAADIGSRATAASSNRDAAQRADTIVLALWLGPMKTVIDEIADLLPGKLVIDTSNPISVGADGNISRTLSDGQSAAEVVSGWLPEGARYAKKDTPSCQFGTVKTKRGSLRETQCDSGPGAFDIKLTGYKPVAFGSVNSYWTAQRFKRA